MNDDDDNDDDDLIKLRSPEIECLIYKHGECKVSYPRTGVRQVTKLGHDSDRNIALNVNFI